MKKVLQKLNFLRLVTILCIHDEIIVLFEPHDVQVNRCKRYDTN